MARAVLLCACVLIASASLVYSQALGAIRVPLNANGEPMINPNPGRPMADPPINPYLNATTLAARCPAQHGTIVIVPIALHAGYEYIPSSPFSWDDLLFTRTMNFVADYPPFAAPKLSRCRDGVCMDAYEMDMYGGTADLGCPAGRTPVLTYNGTYPGPTFLVPAGRQVMVRFNNRMNSTGIMDIPIREPCGGEDMHPQDPLADGRPSTIHLHGGTTIAPYDGWAGERYCPGYSKDYVFATEIVQFAWYHDHSVDFTTDSVYYGLAGLYIVDFGDCAAPWNLNNLPQHIWAIGDRSFEANCSSRFYWEESSLYGDVNAINGQPWPVISMTAVWTRIRFLGASNERLWQVRLVDVYGNDVSSKVCKVYASETGIARVPLNLPPTGLHLVPGERWEVVCNFEGLEGRTLYLWNEYDPVRTPYDPMFCWTHLIGKLVFDQPTPENPARFTFNGIYETNIDGVVSNAVVDQAITAALQKRCTRTISWDIVEEGRYAFTMGIDGENWFTNRTAVTDIGQNTWEIWCMEMRTPIPHPLHLHMTHGYILARGGRLEGVEPYEVFMPKDVWQQYPGVNLTVLVRFGPHQGEWAFHCHNTKHEDKYMMRSMTIIPVNRARADTASRNRGFERVAGDSIYTELADPNSRPPTDFESTPPLSDALDAKLAEAAYRVFYPRNISDDRVFANERANPWKFHCNKITPFLPQNAQTVAASAVAPYAQIARSCGWGTGGLGDCPVRLPALGVLPRRYRYPTV